MTSLNHICLGTHHVFFIFSFSMSLVLFMRIRNKGLV